MDIEIILYGDSGAIHLWWIDVALIGIYGIYRASIGLIVYLYEG